MARDPNPANAGMALPRGGAVAVRLSPETFAKLEDLAQGEGVDPAAMLDRVVEDARRWAFFRRVNRQMAAWQADEEAWSAHEDEMRLWDATLLDGHDSGDEIADGPAPPSRTASWAMVRPLTPMRGDLWLGYLDPVVGREQAGTRPVLVVSSDQFNALDGGLVVIVPVTSAPPRIDLHVAAPAGVGGLSAESSIMCDQVRAISRRRPKRWRGTLDPTTMALVDDRLRLVLGI